eukprot:GHUV01032011.1.p1 GENE.GHUV01032011.1~~GHUV01032011.1.p1  ORF type:complete len:102 (+),score=13.42 GHUV01032011.1:503-808(+)
MPCPFCALQITVFARHARDEILLLASDGLWDVLSNQEATDLALRSIKRARVRPRQSAGFLLCTVISRTAYSTNSELLSGVLSGKAVQVCCSLHAPAALSGS